MIPGGSNNPVLDNRAPDQRFDTSQFAPPHIPEGLAGVFGTVGRNTLIVPRLANRGLSFSKDTALREAKNLEFRAEIFNILNHPNFGPNFGSPSTFGIGARVFLDGKGAVNPNAGRILETSTVNRQVRFGLKFIF